MPFGRGEEKTKQKSVLLCQLMRKTFQKVTWHLNVRSMQMDILTLAFSTSLSHTLFLSFSLAPFLYKYDKGLAARSSVRFGNFIFKNFRPSKRYYETTKKFIFQNIFVGTKRSSNDGNTSPSDFAIWNTKQGYSVDGISSR